MAAKDLFANLHADSLPEWASLADLIKSIGEEPGEPARKALQEMLAGRDLSGRVNVRELLLAIQEELGEPYFARFLNSSGAGTSKSKTTKNK